MSTPNGTLELCFDELNQAYRIPKFCISNPTNLMPQINNNNNTNNNTSNNNDNNNIINNNNDNNNSSISNFSKIEVEYHPINLKIRINPGDFNLNISASTADSIQDLKHFILEQSSQQVRLY